MPSQEKSATVKKRPSKITKATRALSDLAHELGPGAKMPTVAELRSRAGVSVVTLNEALTQAESIGLIDRRHGVGIYVSNELRKGVALVCAPRFFGQSSLSPFWSLLIEHAEKRAKLKNEDFSFHFESSPMNDSLQGPLDDSSFGRAIIARQVQGVVAIGVEPSTLKWLQDKQVPVVTYAAPSRCDVRYDTARGVHTATLALLRSGCRNLELWLPPSEEHTPIIEPENDHAGAFTRAINTVEGAQGTVREAKQISNQTGQQQGLAFAQQVFGSAGHEEQPSNRPDGIVLTNDLMTHGALVALQQLNLKPGRDVHIATHANAGSPILLGHDNLLLMENDPAELAAAMFNLLENLMSGATSQHQNLRLLLAPHIYPIGDLAPSLNPQ